MSGLHLPWLELAILVPLISAVLVNALRNPLRARHWSIVISGVTLLCAAAAWEDFGLLHAEEADDVWHLLSDLLGREVLVIDQLSAPLLPLVALLYFLTMLKTPRTKIQRFSFAWNLVSEAITLAMLSCKIPWLVIVLLSLGTIPPFFELRSRRKSTRVYCLHMALFVGLMVLGWSFVESYGARTHSLRATLPLLAAVCVRSGMVPCIAG